MNLIRRSNVVDFDRVLNDFWRTGSVYRPVMNNDSDTHLSPRVDVTEYDDRYEFVVELPGFSKDEVSVSVEDGHLSIEANHESDETEEKEGRVIRRERRSGSYVRKFHVGEEVDSEAVSASFENGLLKISVPLAVAEEPARRLIEIS
ncbi:Hsp20/alpha crystallin family protein [Gammaproteobacteria bacterium]|nr:Hsp20/alpha crystallin family protein [Gammaproteobacteria bacterium]